MFVAGDESNKPQHIETDIVCWFIFPAIADFGRISPYAALEYQGKWTQNTWPP